MCMNHAFFKEFLDCPTFDRFPKSDCNIIRDLGSEVMHAEVVTAKGAMLEVFMETKGAALEVEKVLAEVPKSPWTPKAKPTKESAKDKEGK